ncbi:histone-lysine N-methyltransferase SETMAR [Trichonephila clavipes]|nr:histone-lysine N-methyltransferase SETMAR [Trichonephila clavipes]
MALGGSLSQINLGIQGETRGGLHKLTNCLSDRREGGQGYSAEGRPPFAENSIYCELQGVKMEVNKGKIQYILQFFFDKDEIASQAAEIVNGVYGANTVTANYVHFWFRRFRSGIFDVKDAP